MALFTSEQIDSLNAFQKDSQTQSFTCENETCFGPVLKATTYGLVCPNCGRVQTKVQDWMMDWSWKEHKNLTQKRVTLCLQMKQIKTQHV